MDGELSWIHSDHLHSATILTDADGAEVRRLAYRAFGEEAENIGSGTEPTYSYTGKERDRSGLMSYGARYYDPELSRFITADTVYDRGTQGLNRYAYALNNPIRYNDPSGHESYDPDEHVERTNELLDLQVHLEGTDGIPLGELAAGDPSAYGAVQGALGVGGDLQPATVDMLEAMRADLGLASPERTDALTAEDVGGIMSRKAERQAAHPILDKWAEIGTASGEGNKFFAISALGSLAMQNQSSVKGGNADGKKSSTAPKNNFRIPKRLDSGVSKTKMWQLGKHYKKHGTEMGYTNKTHYDQAAKIFAKRYINDPKAQIFEGTWGGRGQLHGTVQRAIVYRGRSVILDVRNGQVIDYYRGSELRGLNNLTQIR